jgi:hypothetical protein
MSDNKQTHRHSVHHHGQQQQPQQYEVFSLYIINRAGGLVFHEDFSPAVPKLPTNDYLFLASTFHGLHAIMTQSIAGNIPVRNAASGATSSKAAQQALQHAAAAKGMVTMQARHFTLQSYQTLTGVKFFMTATPNMPHMARMLRDIYQLYAHYGKHSALPPCLVVFPFCCVVTCVCTLLYVLTQQNTHTQTHTTRTRTHTHTHTQCKRTRFRRLRCPSSRPSLQSACMHW